MLRATARDDHGGYDHAEGFRADIELVAESLLAGKGLKVTLIGTRP